MVGLLVLKQPQERCSITAAWGQAALPIDDVWEPRCVGAIILIV